jgi:two-component system sensor histidine kinase CpxA
MRTLFVKIFVWFWLATGVIGGVFFLIASISHNDLQLVPWRGVLTGALRVYAQTAIATYEREGPAAVEAYLQEIRRAGGVQGCLMSETGAPLAGSPPPVRLSARELTNERTEPVHFEIRDGALMSSQRLTGRNAVYFFTSQFERPLFPFYDGAPARGLRFLAAFLTGGLVCYGLARYLAAPVERLRAATRRLAAGDLQARVGPSVGKRRDELADLSRDFDVMAERIETLVVSQNRLLGDISHELRSPLTRLGLALSLARRKSGADANDSLDRIEREAGRLNELIGQLLSLARLEGQGDVPDAERLTLSALLRDVVADADFEARSRGRAVTLTVESDCETRGSAELLRRAAENVIRNAIRYAPENTAVEVRLAQVADKDAPRARIAIVDRGPGVPEADLRNIFRPFYRVGEARERVGGGVGLGLAIADRAVRMHGGTLTARNAPGGFQVEIRLPAVARSEMATERPL